MTRWGDCSVMFFLFNYIENFEFCRDSDIDWNRLFYKDCDSTIDFSYVCC